MEFNKKYNRSEFVNFLQHKFLPEDFVVETINIDIKRQTNYIRSVAKLGTSATLDLVVYEIKHVSVHDARVGLSKEAFRFLADEWENKALVVFVPENNDANYRFSLITIDLCETEEGKLKKIYSNPRRYSYYLGEGIAYYTPNKYLNTLGRVSNEKDLTDRFSVEVLTKAFYQELSDWYAWAVKVIRFPNKLNDKSDDDKYNSEAAIRLVTRLIFVWFLKQKHLIPDEFFDEDYIRENLIDGFNPNVIVDLFYKSNESKYYKAILQNLFFAMLNSPITKEGESELSERRFRSGRGDYDNNKLMRYESMFKNPQLFIDLANKTVPFLNGGLFDCLDDKDNDNYVDGFSDRELVNKYLIVPDYLFFGEEAGKNIDLSEWYGDKKKKKVSARGIIDILKRYNFTVEENTPFDQDVSLDPELLGKVFENLLASYNPETQTTARKQTGSFYTPREIVQYMVDESLIAHLKRTVGEEFESEYRKLISYVDEEILLSKEQKLQVMEAIYHCKVLDPACGSGAFPVGMLQQMVHILSQLDPTNEQWKKMMLDEAVNESRNAFQAESKEEREERLLDIENSFDENLNNPDYARKLYLIENCIYGVDIQPIAIQISKLRFFISLVVDQKTNNDPTKNFGIRPLPNLEAKFVAANSLIPLAKQKENLGRTPEIIEVENRLKEANHKIFSAKTVKTKRKWKERLVELRSEMSEKLSNNGFLSTDAVTQIASWNMFDQNSAASFFDADWMFGIKDGFDVVIGNPPYVNIEFISEKDRIVYQNLYSCFVKRADLFSVFIECGLLKMTKQNGIVTFIVPSVIHSNLSYQKLRDLFLNNHWLVESCYTGGNVFEGPTVDTTILRFDKKGVSNIILKKALDFNEKTTSTVDADYFKTQNNIISIGDTSTYNLYDKLYSTKRPKLSDHFSVFQGIVTGNNPAFIFDSENEALEKGIDKELLHPLCHGRDIARYEVRSRERRILYLNNNINIDHYPQTKDWLTNFKESLLSRREAKKGTIKWYSLQWPRVKSELDLKEKIWIQRTRNENLKIRVVATLDSDACYTSEGILNIIPVNRTVSLHYLLGILNSKLVNYLFATKLLNLAIKAEYLKQLRIPIGNDYVKILLEGLVNNILTLKKTNPQADTSELENQIDFIVYKLYGLTYDEVLVVDKETTIKREEYENLNNLLCE